MDPLAIALISDLVVAWSAVSRRLRAAPVTGPLVFLAAGWALGVGGTDLVDLQVDSSWLHLLAEVTLVLVLFSDAARLELRKLRGNAGLPGRLLGVSLPLTIVAGALAAAVLLDGISGWTALVIAAVLAPTDAALGQAVVSDPRVPVRIRQTLNVESGLNDGLVLPAVTVLVAAAVGEARTAGEIVTFVAQQILLGAAVGVAVGAAGGRLLDRATEADWLAPSAQQLTALAVGFGAWGTAEVTGGNGFVAAFVAGLAFGAVAGEHCEHLAEFAEEEGQLLTLLTFLLIGAVLLGPAVAAATPATVAFALAVLTVVRMLPTAIALTGAGLRPVTVAFIGWFGPRGLASLLFALVIVEESSLEQAPRVLDVVAFAVGLSALLHGATAGPLASRYARRSRAMHPDAGEHGEHPELHGRVRY